MTNEISDDGKSPPELRYIRTALVGAIVLAACVGVVLFMQSLHNNESITYADQYNKDALIRAAEYFVPAAFLSVLLSLLHFIYLMMQHDLQTWLLVLSVGFSLFLMIRAIIESDPTKTAYWWGAFAGVFGFAVGIPIGRFGGRK